MVCSKHGILGILIQRFGIQSSRCFYAGNSELQEFLQVRNPKCQHSSTLESFLIKPIQRVLKYPLLLNQLVELSSGFTHEHNQLQGSNITRMYNVESSASVARGARAGQCWELGLSYIQVSRYVF